MARRAERFLLGLSALFALQGLLWVAAGSFDPFAFRRRVARRDVGGLRFIPDSAASLAMGVTFNVAVVNVPYLLLTAGALLVWKSAADRDAKGLPEGRP